MFLAIGKMLVGNVKRLNYYVNRRISQEPRETDAFIGK